MKESEIWKALSEAEILETTSNFSYQAAGTEDGLVKSGDTIYVLSVILPNGEKHQSKGLCNLIAAYTAPNDYPMKVKMEIRLIDHCKDRIEIAVPEHYRHHYSRNYFWWSVKDRSGAEARKKVALELYHLCLKEESASAV